MFTDTLKRAVAVFALLSSPVLCHGVESIAVQALLGSKVVVLVDGQRHMLKIGERSPEGVRVIRSDANGATLELEGEEKYFELGAPVSLEFAERESIEHKLFADDRGMFLQTGSINGFPVRFLVDTGATSVAMNTTQAKRIGLRYRLEGDVETVSTASGFVKAYIVTLKSVSLGPIRQKNVKAVVIDGKHPGPILLGMTFLSKLKVEKEGGVLTLRTN